MLDVELLLRDLENHGFDIQEARDFLEQIHLERAGKEGTES